MSDQTIEELAKHERHNTNAETRYWCEQYKQKAIALFAQVRELQIQLKAWHEVFGTTQLTHARARLEKAEQSLSTARENTLEEAAKIVDSTDCMDGEPTAAVIAVMEQHGVVESSRAACRATKREISKAIRALKPTRGETK